MADTTTAPIANIHKSLFADPPVYLCLLCTDDGATSPQREAVEAHVRQAHEVEPVLSHAAQGLLEVLMTSTASPAPPEKG